MINKNLQGLKINKNLKEQSVKMSIKLKINNNLEEPKIINKKSVKTSKELKINNNKNLKEKKND